MSTSLKTLDQYPSIQSATSVTKVSLGKKKSQQKSLPEARIIKVTYFQTKFALPFVEKPNLNTVPFCYLRHHSNLAPKSITTNKSEALY